MKALAGFLLCLWLPLVAHGGFYKCTVNGRVVYQETACAEGAGGEVDLKPLSSMQGTGMPAKAGMPVTTRQAPDSAPAKAGMPVTTRQAPDSAPAKTNQPVAASPAPASAPPAAAPTANVSTYDSGDIWMRDSVGYRQALQESARTGAPIFVYFYADWCSVCRKFSAKVLPDTAVRQRLRRFIKVKINTELGAEENRLFRDAGGRGIPFVITQAKPNVRPQVMKLYSNPWAWAVALDEQLGIKR